MLKDADPLKYDVKIMYELLLGAIVILLIINYFPREHFSIGGYEIVNIGPGFNEITCKPGRELDAGLCYPQCRAGYKGVGPVCWAETENIGIGTVIGLEDCPDGWRNDGLTCYQPITGGGCSTHCDGNWDSNDGGFCHTRCEPIIGGGIKGRLDNGGKCPGPQAGGGEHTDPVDSMCYRKCPSDKQFHVPGMPYLCYVGGELAYGRGAGKIPAMLRIAGKYPFLGGED